MATFSIAGNTGGSASAGAQVQYTTDRGDIHGLAISDANGIYSIPGLTDLRTYYLTVTLSGKTYRFQHSVTLAGANVVDVNFNPTAQNASNINTPGF